MVAIGYVVGLIWVYNWIWRKLLCRALMAGIFIQTLFQSFLFFLILPHLMLYIVEPVLEHRPDLLLQWLTAT
jgi:hypothetical protein